jgi:2-polyprenyl-6-methoxyphenol hydroxylase-like FAD-dependent oxidoreductase
MLLARRGRRVLVVDRTSPQHDVLSGHTIQPAGMARLARWGLLERVRATGVPMVSAIRFDFGPVVLEGAPVPVDGIDTTVCIRRTALDPLLADAAAEAGAEVRHGITVTDLVRDGDRVVGIRGHDAAGRAVEERASIVVGADGVNSVVARSVDVARYHVQPASTFSVYSYWHGLEPDRLELYARPGRFFIDAPTNDGLTLVAQQVPVADAPATTGARRPPSGRRWPRSPGSPPVSPRRSESSASVASTSTTASSGTQPDRVGLSSAMRGTTRTRSPRRGCSTPSATPSSSPTPSTTASTATSQPPCGATSATATSRPSRCTS